jgi:hypothetical protein
MFIHLVEYHIIGSFKNLFVKIMNNVHEILVLFPTIVWTCLSWYHIWNIQLIVVFVYP